MPCAGQTAPWVRIPPSPLKCQYNKGLRHDGVSHFLACKPFSWHLASSPERLVHPVRVCLKFNSCAGATGPAMIDFDLIAWDDEDNPRGNVQHIAANGLTSE